MNFGRVRLVKMTDNKLYSFVPAEYAELCITDKILTRMNTQDSVSKVWHMYGLATIRLLLVAVILTWRLTRSKAPSTFMNDLQQISLDLKQITPGSLMLIDEFGKGTNESGLFTLSLAFLF